MERTTATGLWTYGDSYLKAARHVARIKLQHSAPVYFLYVHAIELALKAYLRAQGATLEDLKSIGHSLPELLKRARQKGLHDSNAPTATTQILKTLDVYNRTHEFRYIVTGFKTLPTVAALDVAAAGLLKATRTACFSVSRIADTAANG